MYAVVQGKICSWNGFFATGGNRFESAEEMKDKDGKPIPAAVLERFVKTGCMVQVATEAEAEVSA